jgi:hypothetical protein
MTNIENFPTLVMNIEEDDEEDESFDEKLESTPPNKSFDAQCRAIHTKLWKILDDQNPLSYCLGYTSLSFSFSLSSIY